MLAPYSGEGWESAKDIYGQEVCHLYHISISEPILYGIYNQIAVKFSHSLSLCMVS
jgi:hypothetical protein